MTDLPPPGNYPPPPPPPEPQPGGYEPPTRGYEPSPGGYPPPAAPGGYEPSPGGYPPPGAYPPPSGPGGYGPPPSGYPPPPSGYPPPPPGGYPPPPPSAGGYAPPPPGPAVRALPTHSYTPWFTRVLAFLIDMLPVAVLSGIGSSVQALAVDKTCSPNPYTGDTACVTQPSATGQLVFWVLWLIEIAYVVWNYGFRQGVTGSSIGKSVLKFKVVSETTGQPIGFGMSVVRQIAHIVDGIICYIGYLFPLWDAKRQTLADKIMTTVCLPIA